jgi:hypothetical protein
MYEIGQVQVALSEKASKSSALHNLDVLRHPLAVFQPDDPATGDPVEDVDLVLCRALSPEHSAGLAGDGAGESENRGEPLPRVIDAVDQVVAQPARRVGQDRRPAQRSELSELSIWRPQILPSVPFHNKPHSPIFRSIQHDLSHLRGELDVRAKVLAFDSKKG